jgi:hypothetical protein
MNRFQAAAGGLCLGFGRLSPFPSSAGEMAIIPQAQEASDNQESIGWRNLHALGRKGVKIRHKSV